jgi:hypothetical protein
MTEIEHGGFVGPTPMGLHGGQSLIEVSHDPPRPIGELSCPNRKENGGKDNNIMFTT